MKKGFSLEVFPPKDTVSVNEIYRSLSEFAALKPDFISVTYGAGGSSRRLTKEISGAVQNGCGIDGMAHLTCMGATKENIKQILKELKNEGIKKILALRGDLPKDTAAELGEFAFATDLISFINDFGGFEILAACYPEGHSESGCLAQDLKVAKLKYDLGVRTFISQLFFDNEDFLK